MLRRLLPITRTSSLLRRGTWISSSHRNYCVAKFGLGPRIEKFEPELPGDPIEMGAETEEEYQQKLKELHPDQDYMDPEKALSIYKESLFTPTEAGKVLRMEDEELLSYSPEDFFGIDETSLAHLCDSISGRISAPPPALQTIRRLDRKSFTRLLTFQSRNNLADLAFRTMGIMQVW